MQAISTQNLRKQYMKTTFTCVSIYFVISFHISFFFSCYKSLFGFHYNMRSSARKIASSNVLTNIMQWPDKIHLWLTPLFTLNSRHDCPSFLCFMDFFAQIFKNYSVDHSVPSHALFSYVNLLHLTGENSNNI